MTVRKLGLGCFAAIVVVAGGLYAVILVGLFVADRLGELGSLEPNVSETQARRYVAGMLCPQAPERVLPRLTAWKDSSLRFVEVDAVVEDGLILDSRATFYVYKDESGALVSHPQGESAAYLAEARAACAAGKAPP